MQGTNAQMMGIEADAWVWQSADVTRQRKVKATEPTIVKQIQGCGGREKKATL